MPMLHLFSYCPLCQKANQDVEAHALGSEGNICVWHVRTRGCGHALLTMVLKNKELVSTMGVATDLSVEDVRRVMAQKAVSIDDVLQAHELFGDAVSITHLLASDAVSSDA